MRKLSSLQKSVLQAQLWEQDNELDEAREQEVVQEPAGGSEAGLPGGESPGNPGGEPRAERVVTALSGRQVEPKDSLGQPLSTLSAMRAESCRHAWSV